MKRALSALALLLVGCAATKIENHTFIGKAHTPKSETHPILIYSNIPPVRVFESIAFLDVHAEAAFFQTPTLAQDGLPSLIKQARLAGCDAIMDIKIREFPPRGEFREVHFSGVGIAFK